ncbi:MAG: hypothetical protein ABJB12_21925 [Pseudomonadota bacterium]
MIRWLSVGWLPLVFALPLAAGCAGGGEGASELGETNESLELVSLPNELPFPNSSGLAATFSTFGRVDLTGPFFQSLGSNGRSCGSCHQPSDGWSVTPVSLKVRFLLTAGTDPIFRVNDGSNSPNADVSTVAARRAAYSMLLSKGLIRVGLGIPTSAEFSLAAVDDPYGFASAAELSLFRRPLPTTNLSLLSTVMWDGRETFAGADHCNLSSEGGKCFATVNPFDLADQSNAATLGHAQAAHPLTPEQQSEIVRFEASLFTAQVWDNEAHDLGAKPARGGPRNISRLNTYYGINDNLGDYQSSAAFSPVIFTEYAAWSGARGRGVEAAHASIARGEALFNSRPITISGVAGLNFNSPFNPPLPATFSGTCGTCHDTPSGGDHSIVAPLNIGLTDAPRRTPDLPLYTLRNNATGETVQTTDPGRALITGKWADIGKFKGPILRGLAARAPYFHNGSAKDLGAVIDFYDTRFAMGLSQQEHDDLAAFLGAL